MSQGDSEPTSPEPKYREVRYEHSRSLVALLAQLRASLLVSTYQAGKLVAVSASEEGLALSFHNFEQAMGIALGPRGIAVGTRNQVWQLLSAAKIAPQIEPAGRYDACLLARSSHITGEIHGHEMAFVGDELWIVNTLFSCLCTLDGEHSFRPRWRPPFISALAAEDRCHLNGLALDAGRPSFVTVMAETDTAAGWRPVKATAGCILDIASGAVVARGFAMPHSPRVYQGRLWVLDSGTGRLVVVDPRDGKIDTVAKLPGYTRGLCFLGEFAFIGLSRIRETATFGGIPIAEKRDELKCGVAAVHLPTGNLATLEFKSGVEEIFDVQVLPGVRTPWISGPFPSDDDSRTIWVVPEEERGH